MNIKGYLIIILCLSLLCSGIGFCVEEWEIEHEFMPSEFIFEYNDHNTSVYEGDTGLLRAYTNNTLDNTTLILPVEQVRSVAYATKGSFKFNESIIITHSVKRSDGMYILRSMKYKNGIEIPILDVENDDLTLEQRSYFDNYEQTRNDYLAKQQQYALEDLEDSYSRSRSKDSQSKYSYYFGTKGRGIIYTPSSHYY